jgi:hypothetical protein
MPNPFSMARDADGRRRNGSMIARFASYAVARR